jgi:uncharacterized protein (DUF1684 family)
MKIFIASLSLLASSVAFAHGDKIEMTQAAITQALAQFKTDHPEHLAHFQGVKGWPENDEIKIKIYMPDNATISYTCMHHDAQGGETLQCHMQM